MTALASQFYSESLVLITQAAVFPLWGGVVETLQDRYYPRLTSAFSTDTLGPTNGETRIQLRTWTESYESSGSNTNNEIVSLECDVLRHILTTQATATWSYADTEDEWRYVYNEMSDSQSRLVTPATWRALSSVFDLVTPPTIPNAPERRGTILAYRLNVTVQLNAET